MLCFIMVLTHHARQLTYFCLCLQNTATGNGVAANPKLSDIAYIRDRYFETVYAMVNSSMTSNSAPMNTLRGKLLC